MVWAKIPNEYIRYYLKHITKYSKVKRTPDGQVHITYYLPENLFGKQPKNQYFEYTIPKQELEMYQTLHSAFYWTTIDLMKILQENEVEFHFNYDYLFDDDKTKRKAHTES